MYGVCVCFNSDLEMKQWWHLLAQNFNILSNQVWLRGNPVNRTLFGQVIQTADELPPNRPLVIVQPRNALCIEGQDSLITFQHPQNAIYFFGTNNSYMQPEDLGNRTPDHSIYIPVSNELYSWTAGAMVLYDRLLKIGA